MYSGVPWQVFDPNSFDLPRRKTSPAPRKIFSSVSFPTDTYFVPIVSPARQGTIMVQSIAATAEAPWTIKCKSADPTKKRPDRGGHDPSFKISP
jgi:hypothetical protein